MNRLTITHLPLGGLKLVTRHRLGDSRGSFSRLFCVEELAPVGWTKSIVQINHTVTPKKGTVRGMHFQQPPYSEMKLVTCFGAGDSALRVIEVVAHLPEEVKL